ncbi:MAG: hypothetical protein ACLPZJ_04965, partial [Terriglobales bacterium]
WYEIRDVRLMGNHRFGNHRFGLERHGASAIIIIMGTHAFLCRVRTLTRSEIVAAPSTVLMQYFSASD